jgi:methionyl-tRNA formyltransferase
MKKVVLLGAKNIGFECLKILNENSNRLNYKIVGVLTNSRGDEIKQYSNDNNIKLLDSLEDYLSLKEVDIALSIQYHEILKREHIKKAKELIINLHMAPLPEYRGCNQFSFAMINKDKIFGTTIHKLEEGIDSGDILFEDRFDIPKDCWVEELYSITFEKSINLFRNSIDKIINHDIKPIKQTEYMKDRSCSIHYRNEMDKLKIIDLSWSKDKIERYVKATYMPGFEPPYFLLNNEKVYIKREHKND